MLSRMPTKTRRKGVASEVQILFGMSKEQDRMIKKAAALCQTTDGKRPLTRAEFIRQAAHWQAQELLQKAGKL